MECAHSALGPKLRALACGLLVRKVYMRIKSNVKRILDLLAQPPRNRYYASLGCRINGSAAQTSLLRGMHVALPTNEQ
jgi:hypothetical protein